MKLAMIGLGRMGGNMARRLLKHGHEVVAFDRNAAAVAEAAKHGAIATSSFAMLAEQLPSPAIYWIMLPAGEITENTIGKSRRSRSRVTSSSTAGTASGRTISGAPSCWRSGASTTSMSVCPAASGAWREAIA